MQSPLADERYLHSSQLLYLLCCCLCESFSLPSCSRTCWLPLFIAVLVALVSPQLADLQLMWLLLQLKCTGAWKREGTGGQFGLPAAPWRLTVRASRGLVSMCRHSGHLRSSVGFCERKAAQCQRVLFLALLASLWQGSAQLCFLLVWEIWKRL